MEDVWPASSLSDAPQLKDVTTHQSRGKQSRQGESTGYLVKTRHVQMERYVPTRMTLAQEAADKLNEEARLTSPHLRRSLRRTQLLGLRSGCGLSDHSPLDVERLPEAPTTMGWLIGRSHPIRGDLGILQASCGVRQVCETEAPPYPGGPQRLCEPAGASRDPSIRHP